MSTGFGIRLVETEHTQLDVRPIARSALIAVGSVVVACAITFAPIFPHSEADAGPCGRPTRGIADARASRYASWCHCLGSRYDFGYNRCTSASGGHIGESPSPYVQVRSVPSREELERRRESAFQAYAYKGIRAYNAGDYRSAVHWFRLALRLAPHNPTARHNYMRARQKMIGIRVPSQAEEMRRQRVRDRTIDRLRERVRRETARRQAAERRGRERQARLAAAKKLKQGNMLVHDSRAAVGRAGWVIQGNYLDLPARRQSK